MSVEMTEPSSHSTSSMLLDLHIQRTVLSIDRPCTVPSESQRDPSSYLSHTRPAPSDSFLWPRAAHRHALGVRCSVSHVSSARIGNLHRTIVLARGADALGERTLLGKACCRMDDKE